MKNHTQVEKRIQEIEADSRYQSGLKHRATIDINAPLALVQLSLETELKTLRWMLAKEDKEQSCYDCKQSGFCELRDKAMNIVRYFEWGEDFRTTGNPMGSEFDIALFTLMHSSCLVRKKKESK